jgi:hypothetical protein
LKLWFIIYIAHTVIFSTPVPGDDMGKCQTQVTITQAFLRALVAEPVNVNIAPQYRKTTTPERTMYCMWSEKDPAFK